MAKEGFGCGRPECKCSTTIADQASFGTGPLSDYGFFAEGCAICAAAWKKIHPEDEVWPPLSEEDTF